MNKTCCSVDDAFGFKGGVREGWGGLMTFVVDCKPRWCCLVDDEQNMLFGGWCIWFQRGVRGVNDVRCGLQTKMMLFGGWWTKLVRWMMHLVSKGGFGWAEAKPWRKKDLLSWRVNRISQGEFAQVLAQKKQIFLSFPKNIAFYLGKTQKTKKTQVKHIQKQHAKKQNRHETCISNKIPLKKTANSAGPFRHPPPCLMVLLYGFSLTEGSFGDCSKYVFVIIMFLKFLKQI